MRLPEADAWHFMGLYVATIGWCARQLDPKSAIHDAVSFGGAPLLDKVGARDRMFDHPDLIDQYVAANPDQRGPEDLALIQRWRSFVRGDLIVERDLKQYTVFLDNGEQPVAYGVLSLVEEIVDVFPPPLPKMVEAVLLPWRGVIVCDGLVRYKNVIFGPGIREQIKDAYKQAKARGLITRLGDDPSVVPRPKKAKRSTQPGAKKPFIGKWRIVEMEAWEVDYVDMDGPAFIKFETSNSGYFQFGLIQAEIDCRFSLDANLPTVEFSWSGDDEGEPVCGRGRARIDDDGVMQGRIFIHGGDESVFVATRVTR